MKNIYYLVFILLFLSSCNRVDYLLKHEKYKRIIKISERKLFAQKDLDLEWIKAYELAFHKRNEIFWQHIEELETRNDTIAWKKVVQLANYLDEQQSKVAYLIPVKSVEGYTASLKFEPTKEKIKEGKNSVARLYFESALVEIYLMRRGSKRAAKSALGLIDSALAWRPQLYEAETLRAEAIDSGTISLAIHIYDDPPYGVVADHVSEYLYQKLSANLHQLLEVKINPSFLEHRDYDIHFRPTGFFIGLEQEHESTTEESAEICVGHETNTYWCEKDSVWITETVEIIETVYATITEYEQSKSGWTSGKINFETLPSRQIYHQKDIHEYYNFSNDYTVVEGDSRATCSMSMGWEASYPTDEEMEQELFHDVAEEIIYRIRKFPFWKD